MRTVLRLAFHAAIMLLLAGLCLLHGAGLVVHAWTSWPGPAALPLGAAGLVVLACGAQVIVADVLRAGG
jgi:hypothetical protein